MEKHGPWITKNVKVVHDTPWIRIEHCEVVNPGGGNGNYSTVHFKNLAIGIVPIDHDGNVYLVGQYRYPLKAYSWEIPEGGGDLNEAPVLTAKRELKEETGLTADRWEELFVSHLSNSATDEKGIVFLARDLTIGEAEPEEDEDIKIKKVTVDAFIEMVYNEEITDALSMMAAYRLEIMKLKGEL